MTKLINANSYETYEDAHEVYCNAVVPTYGATRMDWGFGRWLWLDCTVKGSGRLETWRLLRAAGILTADGRKRLERAEKEAARKEAE